MKNSISQIVAKILAWCILIAVLYVLGVFLFPELLDTYGHADINAMIRNIKEASLNFASEDGRLHISQ